MESTPASVLLKSPRSTHAVGAGAAGQPVLGSQQRTLPTDWVLVTVLFEALSKDAVAEGVAKTQLPVEQPHGFAAAR